MSVRIVSLNAWGGRLYAELEDFVTHIDADVLCLQEVFHAPDTALSVLPDGNGRTLRPNLFDNVRRALSSYQASFCPAAGGYLNDRTTTDVPVFYGIATFIRRTMAVLESRSGFVFGSFRAKPIGNPPLPRTAHAFRLWDHGGDLPIVIAHAHGLWDPRGKMDTPERDVQANRLKALVDSVVADCRRVVICGDLNILPESRVITAFREWYRLEELVTTRGHNDTRTSYYPKKQRYADYMLVSHDVRVLGFDVPAWPEVSDHRPLILDCC